MNIVSDTPDGKDDPAETPAELLARLMRCPKLKAAVCKVARSQGVKAEAEEDVYQETLLRMSKATLPVVEADARKYVNGMAKYVAIDFLRELEEQGSTETESLEGMKREPIPVRERIEQRTQIKQVFRLGRALFGEQVWSWWERNKVHKETSQEIGRAAGVKASHVRHEVSAVSRWVDSTWGKRTGSIGGVFVLLLAVAGGWKWTHRPIDESQMTTFAEVRAEHGVVGLDAGALRERGKKACDEGAWGACEEDLAAAAALDSSGETVELLVMKMNAAEKQMRHDADGGGKDGERGGGSELNAKPGR